MKVYCTSKNSGPTWTGIDPVYLKYLGTSLDEAIVAVGDFVRYERQKDEFPTQSQYLNIYTALPREMSFILIKYFSADGWWYSIVEFELEDKR